MSRLARGLAGLARDSAGLLLVAQGSTAAVALVANVLASRWLAPAGRGELALFLQLAYLAGLGVVLGTDRSLVAVYTGSPVREAARAHARLLLRPALTVAALGAAVVWLLPVAGLGGRRAPAAVAVGFCLANAFVRAVRAVAIAGRRQRDFLVGTLVEQALLLALLGLLAATATRSVAAWLAAYLTVAASQAAVYLVGWSRRGRSPGPSGGMTDGTNDGTTDEARRRAVRREGLQLLPSSLANTGMLRIDRILLAPMAGTAALGHYAAVATFTELLTWPLLAYADNRTGVWRRRHERGDLRVAGIVVAGAGVMAAGAVVTAGLTHLMVPLLGPGFDAVRGLVTPLVLAAGVLGLSQLVTALLVARGRNLWASAGDTTGFVVSLTAYLTLIPSHGAAGAAWGSLVGYSAALVVGGAALALPPSWTTGPTTGPTDRRTARREARRRLRQQVTGWPDALAGLPATAPATGWITGCGLVLVAVAGRYTLERAGVTSLAWVDLRLVGLVVVLAGVVHELRRRGGPADHRPAGWLVAALLFFGYQILSAGWAPPGADTGAGVVDLVALALLTVGFYLHGRTWPDTAGRRTWWLLWTASVVFALGAFAVTGPGEQGRYAAFGGGPNVFVRIEVLGLLAVVTLLALGATRHLLWSVPLLLAGAVLSGSRGGLLAAALVGGAAALAGRRRARRIATIASAATALVLVAAYRLHAPGWELVHDRWVEQTLQQGYDSGRPAIFAGALRLGWEHPLLGVGIDGFRVLVGARIGAEYPHNYLLSVGAETGGLGLALLATTVVLWVGAMRRLRPWPPLTRGFVAAAGFVALASLASGDYYDSRFAWCFAALAAATGGAGTHPDAGSAGPGDVRVGGSVPGGQPAGSGAR